MGESKNRVQPQDLGLTAPAVGADPGPCRDCSVLPVAGPLAAMRWPVWRCWHFWVPGLWGWLAAPPRGRAIPGRRHLRFFSCQLASVSRGNLPVGAECALLQVDGAARVGPQGIGDWPTNKILTISRSSISWPRTMKSWENSRPPASFTRRPSPGAGPIPPWPIIFVSLIILKAVGKRRRRASGKPWPVIPAMSRPATIWGSCIAVSAARTRPGGSGRKQKVPPPLTPSSARPWRPGDA